MIPVCWHGGPLKLSDYRQEIQDIKSLTYSRFREMDGDVVYEVVLHFRDDEDLAAYGINSGIFKQYVSAERYILNEARFLEEEELSGRAYWSVMQYKLQDGEYSAQAICFFSTDLKLLSIRLLDNAYLAESTVDYNYLLTCPKNIEVPYQIGDILKIHTAPFGKDIYVVYGGEHYVGERAEGIQRKWDSQNHLCIYWSDDHEEFRIGDLSNDCFGDYGILPECPLIGCEAVSDCADQHMKQYSRILKESPEKWYAWVQNFPRMKRNDAEEDVYGCI